MVTMPFTFRDACIKFVLVCFALMPMLALAQTKKTALHKANHKPLKPVNIDQYIYMVPTLVTSFGRVGQSLPDPFVPAKALQQLIPGNCAHFPNKEYDEADKMDLDIWINNSMPRKTFLDGWGQVGAVFPYKDGNVSEPKDTLVFTDDSGFKNIYFAISTHDGCCTNCMFCGHEVCVTLGLAWYRLERGRWVLKSFNPALGCYGQFQHMPDLHLVKLGKNNFGCYLHYLYGGSGGPYFGDINVFALVNNQFRLVLKKRKEEREDIVSFAEDESLENSRNPGEKFAPLSVRIKGSFEKFHEPPKPANAPDQANSNVKMDTCRFNILHTYKFNGRKYVKAGSKVNIK